MIISDNEKTIKSNPIIGKTYSLYGHSFSSDLFFDTILKSADQFISWFGNAKDLLVLIRNGSKKKRLLKNLILSNNSSVLGIIIRSLHKNLSMYTQPVKQHLAELPLLKRCESTLTLSQEQYYLYMLEIELTNIIYKQSFLAAEEKMAFLPYCMHDFSKDCLSAPDAIDYVCKGCSKDCSINIMSKLLREKKVKPYIWMYADLKRIFKGAKQKSKSIGVLGVACIPELVHGMRLCDKAGIPVVGIPLDANRCKRWMGEFFENTINLKKLDSLF